MSRYKYIKLCSAALFILIHPAINLSASAHTLQPARQSSRAQNSMVLSFPDGIELEALAQFVSDGSSLNILYDNNLNNKSIHLISPNPVRSDDLLELLRAALRVHKLTLAPTSIPSTYSIVQLSDISRLASIDATTSSIVPQIRIFKVEHASATQIVQSLTKFLSTSAASAIALSDDQSIMVTDLPERFATIESIIRQLDDATTPGKIEFVSLKHTLASEVIMLLSSLLQEGPSQNRLSLYADSRSSRIILKGTATKVAQAIELIHEIDVPTPLISQRLRIYPLEYAVAADAATLLESSLDQSQLQPGQLLSELIEDSSKLASQEPTSMGASTSAVESPFSIVIDEPRNTLLITASPSTHTLVEYVLEQIDMPVPQVLIEITLVVLNTTDNFGLGIELANSTGSDPRLITFSAFGLADRNEDGSPKVSLSDGFSGFLFGPGDFAAIVRAFERNSRSKVISAPMIIVNDNQTATIASTSQEPIESFNTYDGGNATTSFAGYADAGTSITVTPRVQRGNRVKIEYSVELSSFSDDRIAGLPPPRQQSSIESIVNLPNGYTIATGGIQNTFENDSKQTVPFLGDIPLLGSLFSNSSTESSESTLFVFIRATIQDQESFTALRSMTSKRLEEAAIEGGLPKSDFLRRFP